MAKKETADEKKARLTEKVERIAQPSKDDYVSFGLTRLNLAVSGRVSAGLPTGTYVYFVGDSSSGKTFFAHYVMAEAANNPRFDGYRLIYDPSENGALMDVTKFFGRKLAERIEPLVGTCDEPSCSRTVQEFYYNVDAALDTGPCIIVEDSMDALIAEEVEEVFQAEKKKHLTGEGKPKGSYGAEKAKANSQNINRIVQRLAENGSILIIISQTRDAIGGGSFTPKTRSGGRALRFYAHLEIWTSLRGAIRRTVKLPGTGPARDQDEREIGRDIALDIRKNRISGWEGEIVLPFYRAHGFDETGSLVDFLLDERYWAKEKSGSFTAPEFDFVGRKEALIAKIETENRERELAVLVGRVWRTIEEASALVRKPRYE